MTHKTVMQQHETTIAIIETMQQITTTIIMAMITMKTVIMKTNKMLMILLSSFQIHVFVHTLTAVTYGEKYDTEWTTKLKTYHIVFLNGFTTPQEEQWPYGRPAEEYKEGTEITDIANSIFAEELAYKLIPGTNKRARDYNDTKYTPIPETTDGIKKVKGYFAVLIGSAIKGNIPIEDIYCQIEGVGDRWLASFMDEKDFTAINRNIKWVCDDDIPDAYVGHPYWSVKPPADEMRAISRSLWVAGLILTFDECRLRSKARGDRYKNRNAKEADGYVLNEIVYAGEHTYTNNE